MIDADERRPGVTPLEDDDQPKWWLILIALSSWSYLQIWSSNVEEIAAFFLTHFAAWVVGFSLLGGAVQQLSARLLRGPCKVRRSFAVAAISLISVQAWNSQLAGSLDLWLRLLLHLAVTAVVVAITLRLGSAFPQLRAVFGVLTVFLVGVPYLTAISQTYQWIREGPPNAVRPAATTPVGGEAPDVFVVVLDEYTSSAVLESEFGFDNSAFESSLRASGISVVPDARSNYASTRLSVAGVLDGRYPAVGGSADTTFSDLHEIHSGNNILFSSLRSAGYETHLFDNAWTFTRCGENVDVCHASGMDELDWLVAKRTPFVALFPWLQVSPWIRGSLNDFEDAAEIAGDQQRTRPRLIYLHALVPHAPLQLRADCSAAPPGIGSLKGLEDTPAARAAYVEQLKCVNSEVLRLVQAIPENSVLFLTGDHGVRWAAPEFGTDESSPQAAATNLGVFLGYRFNDGCAGPMAGVSLMSAVGDLFTCLGISVNSEPEYRASQADRFFTASRRPNGVYQMAELTTSVHR